MGYKGVKNVLAPKWVKNAHFQHESNSKNGLTVLPEADFEIIRVKRLLHG